jgi:mRNA-degrading endonuclease toxin of MazEF toxin-antitoxin module
VRSGDVLRVDFGLPVGSTPALIRPAVVVTADQTLAHYTRTMHVVPITSNVDRAWTTDVPVAGRGLAVESAAQCHLCAVIDTSQVVEATGANVGVVALSQIRSVIGDLLDIP